MTVMTMVVMRMEMFWSLGYKGGASVCCVESVCEWCVAMVAKRFAVGSLGMIGADSSFACFGLLWCTLSTQSGY